MCKLGMFSFCLLVKDMPECYHHETTALCRVQGFIIFNSERVFVLQCVCVGIFVKMKTNDGVRGFLKKF
jgi:hypothetical protein